MVGFDFTPCVGNLNRGSATKHPNNDNVIMNSANLFYGGPKTGKTRLIVTAFKNTDYVFLDFDNNYDDVAQLIIDNGGKYYNGKNAVMLLEQLLTGKITDTVVIIDAMNDVKMLMLDIQIERLTSVILKSKDADKVNEYVALQKTLERVKKAGIGQFQEPTSIWYTHTIGKMLNHSNSINFVHHTTQNAQGDKMEGNQSAYASKFDTVYAIARQDINKSYFDLQTQRSNIAELTIGLEKGLKDAENYMIAMFNNKVKTSDLTMTGTELDKAFNSIAKWVKPFKKEVLKIAFIRGTKGKNVSWSIKTKEEN